VTKRLVLIVLGALAVAVPAALAGHFFGDVPGSSPHHDDVTAIANAGISVGCNPPTNDLYCPDAAVRRDQMASFLRRGLGRGGYGTVQASPTPSDYTAPVGAVSVTPGLPAGARPTAAGFVTATAQVTVRVANASGCPCLFMGDLWSQESGFLTAYPAVLTVTAAGYYPLTLTGIGRFTTSGPKQIGVYVARTDGTAQSEIFGQVTAQYLPFGPTGGNTLPTTAPQQP
jgi:hypothetical protein